MVISWWGRLHHQHSRKELLIEKKKYPLRICKRVKSLWFPFHFYCLFCFVFIHKHSMHTFLLWKIQDSVLWTEHDRHITSDLLVPAPFLRGEHNCAGLFYCQLAFSGNPYLRIPLPCMVVRCHCCQSLSCVWLFEAPWTAAHQAPLSTGLPRQEYWSGLPLSAPGDLPKPEIKPASPTLAGRFFTAE